MADQTTASITIEAAPAEVMSVITDYEAYPEWTGSMKEARIVSRLPDGKPERVHYVLDAGILQDSYTLLYSYPNDHELHWTLDESGKLVKGLVGVYLLMPSGPTATDVTYTLAVDVALPLIGAFKRKAEKIIIDTALKELKKRVEG